MKKKILGFGCAVLFAACAWLAAQGDAAIKLKLSIRDADANETLAGIVRVLTEDGKPLPLAGLYERMTGLDKKDLALGWHVLPAEGAEVSLPRAKLRVEALSGLETTLARADLDLTKKNPDRLTLE